MKNLSKALAAIQLFTFSSTGYRWTYLELYSISTGIRWMISYFLSKTFNFKLIITVLCATLGIATQLYAAHDKSTTDKPNFIILLSDDQNWDGLSVQMDPADKNSRSKYIQTPNIEKLAHQGIRFTQAYASSPVCSPTRIAIQTGKTPAQLHWTKAAPNVGTKENFRLTPPQSIRNIPASETTIAELLKSEGYMTAHFGKWHLGGGGPRQHGYDGSDGDTSNRDAAPFTPPNPVDIFGMGDRAVKFMHRAKSENKPFYIQMSYHVLHYPENALPETIAKYREILAGEQEKKILSAAIAENLDTGVGRLLDSIDNLKLTDSTYVIYLSDNGGGGGGKHRTLRGGKGTLWEGGIRVPCIIRGPGIKADSFCNVPIVTHDLLPTLCKLAGVKQPMPPEIEGGDFSHLLAGETGEVKRRFPGIAFHFPHYQEAAPHSALRLGDYKIIIYYENDSSSLYNIAEDPSENSDIKERMPEVAGKLENTLKHYLHEINAMLPAKNPHYDPSKPTPELKKKRSAGGALGSWRFGVKPMALRGQT